MKGIELHKFLEKKGLKVKAETNHPKDTNVDVTIYENEEFYIVVEEKNITPTKVVTAIVNPETSHPVTGEVTPNEAKDLLFEATRSK